MESIGWAKKKMGSATHIWTISRGLSCRPDWRRRRAVCWPRARNPFGGSKDNGGMRSKIWTFLGWTNFGEKMRQIRWGEWKRERWGED